MVNFRVIVVLDLETDVGMELGVSGFRGEAISPSQNSTTLADNLFLFGLQSQLKGVCPQGLRAKQTAKQATTELRL